LTRDEAVRRLQEAESEIRCPGVERLALFGSVLRGEARPDSDVDILVGFASANEDVKEKCLDGPQPGPGALAGPTT